MSVRDGNERAPGYKTRWTALVFISVSLMVISLDNTILNVALPSLSRDFHATTSELQWFVDIYTLIFAALLLTTGTISDRVGRKRTLQLGLILFGIGSAAAALSTSSVMLIAVRAFLGFAGALIMPSTLSIVNVVFPAKERPQAIAIWAMIFGVGFAAGPVIGGGLLRVASWHLLFLINVPIAVIAILGGQRTIVENRDETAGKIDLPGVLLSSTGLLSLIYAIIEAGSKGWNEPSVLLAFGAAFILLALFIRAEFLSPEPMLPLYLFKNLSFSGASFASALLSFGMAGGMFFLSQYMQTILGYDTFQSGLGMLPMAFGTFVIAPLSAPLSGRIGVKFAVALGIGLSALGMLFMSQMYRADSQYVTLAIGQLILTTGLSISIAPSTNSIMSAIPKAKSGIGSAMNDTTRELGAAVGVAVLGTVMNSTYIHSVQVLKTLAPDLSAQVSEAVSSGVQTAHMVAAGSDLSPAARALIISTTNRAFVGGMSNAMLVGAAVMALSALFVLLVLPSRIRPSEPVHASESGLETIPAGD